jgi:hypothetical protein
MAKRRAGSQIGKFDSRTLKVENRPDFLTCRWSATYHWKSLNKGYNFASYSSQSKVCTQSYGVPKSWESQFWEFWDSHLGIQGQNVIWMWASWRGTKYNIRGKVVVATLTWPNVGVKPNTWKSWGFGVLRDSRMFRARQQDPKHLALGCSWCHWKGLET